MLLEDFDPEEGVITPFDSDMEILEPLPKILIAPFSGEILSEVVASPNCRYAGKQKSINGFYPIYIYKFHQREFLISMAPLGAPACIGFLEEFLAQGVEKVIIFGSCGVLAKTIKTHQIILPTSAFRDEGTGYHYAPASEEIALKAENIATLENFLMEEKIDFIKTKTWTTDAFFRETVGKVKKRLAAGCQVVDMECSALACWSQFRQVDVFQFFYTADHVDFENRKWQQRKVERSQSQGIMSFFQLALTFAETL